MNEWKEIIKKYFKCVVSIALTYKGEQISYGTGTVCNEDGKIITACHVIDQIKEFENELHNIELLVRIESYGVIHYKPALTGIMLSIPDIADDILIDVAIIEPIEPIQTDYFVKPVLTPKPIDYGESMLIAGFSEETPFIFDFDKLLGKKIPAKNKNHYETHLGFMKPPTFKSGILSHKASLYLKGNMNIQSEILHIDNGMHSGA